MDKSLQKYSSLDAMKAAEYRYWQAVPAYERIKAAWRISAELYRLNGVLPDAQSLRSSFVRLQRSRS